MENSDPYLFSVNCGVQMLIAVCTFVTCWGFVATMCVRAISNLSPEAASSRDRRNSVPERCARPGRRCVPTSRRAFQSRGPTVLGREGPEAALVFHEQVWGGRRTSGFGAVQIFLSIDRFGPSVEPTGCSHPENGRPVKWIRHAAIVQLPQFGGLLTWLRPGAHIPSVLA
jgi:hypothetical protein